MKDIKIILSNSVSKDFQRLRKQTGCSNNEELVLMSLSILKQLKDLQNDGKVISVENPGLLFNVYRFFAINGYELYDINKKNMEHS